MRLRWPAAGLCALAFVVVLVGDAHAYPEFLLSTGASQCSECHFSPTGGGLLNDWGRDEAASTLSESGDGRFLHGAIELPERLALGADLRLAALANQVRGSHEVALFPMQGDVYARVEQGNLALSVTAGVIAAIREPKSVSDRIGAREYYAIYRAESEQWYVRAGRFYPKAGLRMPDHTAFVRRYTGRYLLEEDHALAAGYTRDQTQWNMSVITPLEIGAQVGRRGWGASAHWERLLSDGTAQASLGARGRRFGEGDTGGWLSGTYSKYFEGVDLLWQSELDLGGKQILEREWITQLVWYGALHWRAGTPLGLSVAGHYFDPNLTVRGQERAALDLGVRHFWKGHFELSLLLRGEEVDFDHPSGTVLLQAHYFL